MSSPNRHRRQSEELLSLNLNKFALKPPCLKLQWKCVCWDLASRQSQDNIRKEVIRPFKHIFRIPLSLPSSYADLLCFRYYSSSFTTRSCAPNHTFYCLKFCLQVQRKLTSNNLHSYVIDCSGNYTLDIFQPIKIIIYLYDYIYIYSNIAVKQLLHNTISHTITFNNIIQLRLNNIQCSKQ